MIAAGWNPHGVFVGVPLRMLADLGLERSPSAERGLIVWAIITCVLAAVSVLAGGWKVFSARPAPESVDLARGWPFMRRTLAGVAQVGAGVALVFVLSRLVSPQPERPAGWSLITPPREASAVVIDDDVVWAGGKEGLSAIDRKTQRLRQTPLDGRDFRGVRALIKEPGSLWIGCRQGLVQFDGKKVKKLAPRAVEDPGPVYALCRARDGSLWIGATEGAWCLRDGNWAWHGAAEGLHLPTVDVIFEDRRGALWFGSMEPEAPGLWKREGMTWTRYDHTQGLISHAVNGLMEDYGGTLWVAVGFGTSGGAQAFQAGRWVPPLGLPGLEGRKIRSLFEDSMRRQWFCSEYDGAAVRDGDQWRRLTVRDGLPGAEIKHMAEDAEGGLWMATEKGVGCLQRFR